MTFQIRSFADFYKIKSHLFNLRAKQITSRAICFNLYTKIHCRLKELISEKWLKKLATSMKKIFFGKIKNEILFSYRITADLNLLKNLLIS